MGLAGARGDYVGAHINREARHSRMNIMFMMLPFKLLLLTECV